MNVSRIPLPMLALLGVLATACGGNQQQQATDSGTTDSAANVPVAELGSGWSELITVAQGSEIKIGTTGHFTSSRGLCSYNREFGVIKPVGVTNQVMHNVNVALNGKFRPAEYCFRMENLKNVSASIELAVSKTDLRQLFIPRGGEICTRIDDQKVASALLSALDLAIGAALKEGCPQNP